MDIVSFSPVQSVENSIVRLFYNGSKFLTGSYLLAADKNLGRLLKRSAKVCIIVVVKICLEGDRHGYQNKIRRLRRNNR